MQLHGQVWTLGLLNLCCQSFFGHAILLVYALHQHLSKHTLFTQYSLDHMGLDPRLWPEGSRPQTAARRVWTPDCSQKGLDPRLHTIYSVLLQTYKYIPIC